LYRFENIPVRPTMLVCVLEKVRVEVKAGQVIWVRGLGCLKACRKKVGLIDIGRSGQLLKAWCADCLSVMYASCDRVL